MSAFAKQTLDDISLDGRRVLVRVDFNVPLAGAEVADDTRIRAALPTVQHLIRRDCRVILVSHLGRPKGKVVEELRLDPAVPVLARLLDRPVAKVDQVTGATAAAAVESMKPGDVLLLENVRFDPREEANDPGFARELAALADVFVNDAFGTAHRAHASTEGVAHFLPAVAGRLVAAELNALSRLVDAPPRPFWVVVGGAKVADKLGFLDSLLARCDGLVLGGGMANTFLAARGCRPGGSQVEEALFDRARRLLDDASSRGVSVLLPEDVVAADTFSADAPHEVYKVEQVPPGKLALDIGPASRDRFRRALAGAAAVFWNGPMGVFEWDAFAGGTLAMATAIADSPAWTVIAGGDSVAAAHRCGVGDRLDHISTGGGAALKFLAGETLPGVEALLDVVPDRHPGR